MKIIITEDQYKKLLPLHFRRRLMDIMNEGLDIIDNSDDFYWEVNFCYHYPTFERFVQGFVFDIVQQYDSSYDISEVGEFIDDHLGYETFVNILLDTHGDKIRSFYNERTKDC